MKQLHIIKYICIWIILVWSVGCKGDDKPLQIVQVNPSGTDVPNTRQLVFQFNHEVVPIGAMQRKRKEIPITISPAVDCNWRWLDRSALACQLSEKAALKKSTQYTMTVWPGIKDSLGRTLEQPYTHRFTTERPEIKRVRFKTWDAPVFPVLIAVFNQPVSMASIQQHVFFEYQKQRLAVKVLSNPDDRDKAIVRDGNTFRRVWLIQPVVPLALNSRVTLKSEAGLQSAFGDAQSVKARTLVEFDTFPEFTFNGIYCRNNNNKEVLINALNRDSEKCNPLSRIALNFSTPVINSEVSSNVLFIPDLAGDRKDYNPWANYDDYSRLHRAHKKGESYNVWLPETLKANQQYRLLSIDRKTINDEFGRSIHLPEQAWFFTDHRLPNYELVHHYSVLEQQVDSELPIYVTNLEQLTLNYKSLTQQGASDLQQAVLPVQPAADIAYAKSMDIRELLLGESGAVYGRIDSQPVVKKAPYEQRFFSQVTPFQVHVKLGHFNTLVWVTDFATGLPVSNARVTIYKDAITQLADDRPILSEAKTDTGGTALLAGSRSLDPILKTFGWKCYKDDCPRLIVRVEKQGDMALVPLNNHFQINTYRASGYSVYPRQRKQYGHIHSWGTTAQGVYRAGDTMQYKIYVRDQNNNSLTPAPGKGYELRIIDPSGKPVYSEKNIKLSEFGAFDGEFKIPETALVGWYQFKLLASFSEYDWQPMRVLVSDFTPSPFKVSNTLNGSIFHPGDELDITTLALLHSGGPYTLAPVKVTVNLESAYFSSDHAFAKGFNFNQNYKRHKKQLLQQSQKLDYQGQNQQQLKLPKTDVIYGNLRIESSVSDDRGKSIAAQARAKYLAVDRLVGMKSSAWVFDAGKKAVIDYLVVDSEGQPSAQNPVNIKIEYQHNFAARVKGAGNAYLTEFKTEWQAAGECNGISRTQPSECSFIPEKPGTYRLTATTTDTQGNTQSSQIQVWVAGKGQVTWRQANDHSLQIIPEQKQYQVGDTARYLIKNPYPGAQALITLERYGVIKQWQQSLPDSASIIEFPVEKSLLPGFYLSVLINSPRVAQPLGEGNVDLGKPAFKIGYVKVEVNDPWKQIDVTAKTDKPDYKPRESVTVNINAKVRHQDQSESIELAVVVLDEAVLDLIKGGKRYFDPYRGFYHLDGLDLNNYSLLTRLIGRQKFEKKGASAGGDGGHALSMRNVFKYVSYWNPSLKTNAEGRAEFQFKLPDNLTGWRVLVIAVTPSDRMGLGDVNFKVNQNTELRPVMPNQVMEGDRFQAGFSVTNRSDKTREIDVTINAKGDLKGFQPVVKSVKLEPYQRTTVFAPVDSARLAVDANQAQGEILFSVKAADSLDQDALSFKLPVLKSRQLLTAADYGSTTEGQIQETLLVPATAYADVGAIDILLSPSVIGNVDGAFKYMRDYPYLCWEQKLSKAVMAAHFGELEPWLDKQLKWPESKTLPENVLAQAANYQAPNGGMTYYLAQDQYVSPYLSAYTALAFNWLKDSGYKIPHQVEQRLHDYLFKLLRKNTAPDFYNKGMASTVRSVALAALAEQGKIDVSEIIRYQPHYPYMSLFGKAQYLMAAQATGARPEMLKQLTDSILSHGQQSGGMFSFNESIDIVYERILATPLRSNCAILSAFTRLQSQPMPGLPFKLVRSITQTRGKRDHWENTQENLFCMNALIDYSRRFESEQPAMSIKVLLDQKQLGFTEFTDFRDQAVMFSEPIVTIPAGTKSTLTIKRLGQGRLYHTTRLQYALMDPKPGRDNAGIDIRREYSVQRNGQWQLLESDADPRAIAEVNRGELVRVDIYVSLPTARNYVVVDDPAPGGLEPVNRDLSTASELDAEAGDYQQVGGTWWLQYNDWIDFNSNRWSFYHRELKHDRVRFYSDYLPPGNYHLSYTAQAVAVGEFNRMPVFAEAMYDPDIFGRGRSGQLIVHELKSSE